MEHHSWQCHPNRHSRFSSGRLHCLQNSGLSQIISIYFRLWQWHQCILTRISVRMQRHPHSNLSKLMQCAFAYMDTCKYEYVQLCWLLPINHLSIETTLLTVWWSLCHVQRTAVWGLHRVCIRIRPGKWVLCELGCKVKYKRSGSLGAYIRK